MAKRSRSHKDVEFQVSDHRGRVTGTYRTFGDAAPCAVLTAMSGGKATIDVLVYSEAGARWASGADGVESYREDPDASSFERFEIKVNNVGRVA